jgi:hypothetical protein
MLRRGQKLYYRHTVPVDARCLLNRLEIWRFLRTDSLSVALRRLPGIVARIEMELEHSRAMAGLSVDAMFVLPLNHDPGKLPIPNSAASNLGERVHHGIPLTMAEAYRLYVDDPTRAWTASRGKHMGRAGSWPSRSLVKNFPFRRSLARIVATCSKCCVSYPPRRAICFRNSRRARRRTAHACAATSRSSARQTPTR